MRLATMTLFGWQELELHQGELAALARAYATERKRLTAEAGRARRADRKAAAVAQRAKLDAAARALGLDLLANTHGLDVGQDERRGALKADPTPR